MGALSLVTTMLDGHTQMVLGDSLSGDLSPSRLASAFDHRQREAFCGDPEGWGPLSLNGFYLTSCFVDVVVAVVAVWGSLAGLAALWMLLKKRIPQPVSKNWHFYAKLVRRPHFPRSSAFLAILIMFNSTYYRLYSLLSYSLLPFKPPCMPKPNRRLSLPISDSGPPS